MTDMSRGNLGLLRTSAAFLYTRIRGLRLVGMTVALAFMILVGWLVNQPPILLGKIVDKVVEGQAQTFGDVVPILLVITGIVVATEILTIFRKYIVERIATNIESKEYTNIASHILSVDLSQFTDERIGALNVRIHRSIEGVIKLLKLCFLDFLPTFIVAVVGLFLAAQRNIYAAGIMLAVAVVGFIITLIQVSSQKGIRIELFRTKEDLGANMAELLLGIEYVRASGMIKAETKRTEVLSERFRDREFLHHKWMMSFDGLKQLIEGLGLIAVIGLAAWFASSNIVSKGEVLTLALLYGSVSRPLRDLHRIVDEGFEAALKIGDLEDIYSRPLDRGLQGAEPPRPISAEDPVVLCKGLTVAYGGDGERGLFALHQVDFRVLRGEIVGIVGPSGSGKSTLIKVLLGLVPNYEGMVETFGVEVREIDKAKLAQLVAYVPQVPFIIKGTVRENVTYGTAMSKEWGDDSVRAALSEAQIIDKIDSLTGGLKAEIAEQGRNLAGGEKQRLALARLFLTGPELVLLDEPTAALDTANERLVQDAIAKLVKGKSALIIAHRLNTLRAVDRIVVFDQGRIIQTGTYDELVKKDGLFQTLVAKEQLAAQFAEPSGERSA